MGSPWVAVAMLCWDDNFRQAATPFIGWYTTFSIVLSYYLGLFCVGVYGLQVLKDTDQRNGEHPYLVRKIIPFLPWLWDVFTVTLPPPWGRFTTGGIWGGNEKRWHSTLAHLI
ncbi:hypothetical protein F5Y06DRAFT_270690 [Hypoxylon sp. FL0890]|nr:hypothetical protein F5Y06DRAFT_270690 [Hypoxylon sp. FL0890]